MQLTPIEAAIEAILFAAGEPVNVKDLAAAIEADVKTARALIISMMDKYSAERRGIMIVETDNAFQMCTNPLYFDQISSMYKTSAAKPLSQGLLETLAIIAYKQPVTKGQIEDIRGVNADHAVNRLLSLGLVAEKGRQDTPGRPILFGTSDTFLRTFGLANLGQMPPLRGDYEVMKAEVEQTFLDMSDV